MTVSPAMAMNITMRYLLNIHQLDSLY